MAEYPTHLLEALASRELQLRYIVGATKDEYILPSELLDNAWHFCERIDGHPSTDLTQDQIESVGRLKEAIQSLSATVDRDISADELINSDPCWEVLRNRAAETISVFGDERPNRIRRCR